MTNTERDAAISARIMKIRTENGGSADKCCTCGHAAEMPYRRTVDGKIVEGCIDAIHTAALSPTFASYDWHNRKEARAMRAATLKSLA